MKDKLKRGFTLIEMVISVGLLSIFAIIIIVNINKNLKDQQAKEYAEFIDKIKSAANVYMAANPDAEIFAKDDDGYNIISIDRLVETGLISTDTLVDPSTNLPLSDDSTDLSKKYIKIYDDEKSNEEKSDATLIQYPATGEINKYLRAIKYEMNNFGIGKCETKDYLVGEVITICNPNDDNADFKGWFLDNDLTKEGPLVNSKYNPMEDIIFYAKWFKNKSANITSMKIESATSNYLDYKVKVSLEISDVYSGTLSVCINNQNNVSSCTSWEEISPLNGQNNNYSYVKEIDLKEMFDSSYETGSGKSATLYAFVKNSAYNDSEKEGRTDTSLITSESSTYQIYKYCSKTTVSQYGTFGSCTKKCGTGYKTRTNKVKDTYYSSVSCPDVPETQTCNTQSCCSSTTASYSDWGTCSASCGGGKQTRTVTYISYYDGRTCSTSTQSQDCNTQDCCSSTTVSYGSWSSCSASCGGGIQNRVLTYKSNYDGRTCNITSEEQSCNTGSCCYYSYCQPTGGYYNGRPTYYACGNCGCDSSPNFAEDLLRYKGLDCGSGGGGGGTGSCPSGYNITYSTGFQCYPVCYKATPLVRYGPMSDGTYDWGCYSGWVDTGTQCIHYLCP